MYFSKDNTNKFDLTVKKTVEKAEAAKDQDFWAFFFPTKKVTRVIGFAGQALSGITEFTAIFLAAGGDLKDIFCPANILPAVLALFAVYLFEVIGIRIYLVKIVRQRMNKQVNQKKQSKALFAFNIFLCAVLLTANVLTSLLSVFSSFESEKIDKTYIAIAEIDSIENAKKQIVINKYLHLDSIAIANATAAEAAIVKQYDNEVKVLQDAAWTSRHDESIRGKTAAGIAALTKKHNAAKYAIQSEKKGFLQQHKAEKADAIAAIEKNAENKKKGISAEAGTKNWLLTIFQKFSMVFLAVFIIISVIAIIYEEIYFAGSEVAFKATEEAVKPNLLTILAIGIYQRFIYHPLYILVSWIVGTKAFEYTRILQDKTTFSSRDAMNTAPTFKALKMPKKIAPKKSLQIAQGFEMQSFKGDAQGTKNAEMQGTEMQDAKAMILQKYKPNTVASWYRRAKDKSKSAETRENNWNKYCTAKAELKEAGISLIEQKNHVTIRI